MNSSHAQGQTVQITANSNPLQGIEGSLKKSFSIKESNGIEVFDKLKTVRQIEETLNKIRKNGSQRNIGSNSVYRTLDPLHSFDSFDSSENLSTKFKNIDKGSRFEPIENIEKINKINKLNNIDKLNKIHKINIDLQDNNHTQCIKGNPFLNYTKSLSNIKINDIQNHSLPEIKILNTTTEKNKLLEKIRKIIRNSENKEIIRYKTLYKSPISLNNEYLIKNVIKDSNSFKNFKDSENCKISKNGKFLKFEPIIVLKGRSVDYDITQSDFQRQTKKNQLKNHYYNGLLKEINLKQSVKNINLNCESHFQTKTNFGPEESYEEKEHQKTYKKISKIVLRNSLSKQVREKQLTDKINLFKEESEDFLNLKKADIEMTKNISEEQNIKDIIKENYRNALNYQLSLNHK